MKAISEGIYLAVAQCMRKGNETAHAIRDNLQPLGQESYTMQMPESKLLMTIFTGGKAGGSQVKFSKFYLIVDGHVNPDMNIVAVFKAFVSALKSKFTTGKGGDSAFKTLQDGSFFNAYASVNDTLKFIEEAIIISGATGRPATDGGQTSSRRGGTAGTDKSKEAKDEEEKESPLLKSVFRIGVNCEAEASFNKDAKDPNKYEIEGTKGQSTKDQLVEYYIKLCQEHPLITYLEDPCADSDIEGYKKLKEGLQQSSLQNV